MSLQIRVVRRNAAAILPRREYPEDAGWDLFALNHYLLTPGDRQLVQTGIALEIPPGVEAQVRPRSGLVLKYGVTVLNSPGTIDAGYRGEVGVILINHGQTNFSVTPGMKIAQLVFAVITPVQWQIVETLNDSMRGMGGFGSTGLD